MKLKFPFETMEVEGRIYGVPVENTEGGFSGVVRVSQTGAEILKLLREETTEAAVTDALTARYQAPRETVEADVREFIQKFREKGLLTE